MIGLSTFQGFGNGKVGVEKIIMDYVEDCGYNNLYLSKVVARVFSMKNTPQHIWVIWVYIVWVETECVRYEKIAKHNVS